MSQENKCAIVYFANRPEKEAVRKPLFPALNYQQNFKIYRELEKHVFSQLKNVDLPVIHIDDVKQKGETFAIRFCNAIEQAFNLGFNQLILLGNDAPELDSSVLRNAYEVLCAGNSAVVNTQRGGACLIAINKAHYNRQNWLKLAWQSARLSAALIQELKDAVVLQKVTEVHRPFDVKKIVSGTKRKNPIIFYFDFLLQNFATDLYHFRQVFNTYLKEKEQLRGPPLASLC